MPGPAGGQAPLAAALFLVALAGAVAEPYALPDRNATALPRRVLQGMFVSTDAATGVSQYSIRFAGGGPGSGCASHTWRGDGPGGTMCRSGWNYYGSDAGAAIAACRSQSDICVVAAYMGTVYYRRMSMGYVEAISLWPEDPVWTVYVVPRIGSGSADLNVSPSLTRFGLVAGDKSSGMYRILPNWVAQNPPDNIANWSFYPGYLEGWSSAPAVADAPYSRQGCPLSVGSTGTNLASCISMTFSSFPFNIGNSEYGYFFFPNPDPRYVGTCYYYKTQYGSCAFSSELTWCKSAPYTGQTVIGSNPCDRYNPKPSRAYEQVFVGNGLVEDATPVNLAAYVEWWGQYVLTPEIVPRVRREAARTTRSKCGEMPPRVGVRIWDGSACFTVASIFHGWFPTFAGYNSPDDAVGINGGRIWTYAFA